MSVDNPTKYRVCKEDYVLNLIICACETNKYLRKIADDLVIKWDEIIDVSDILAIYLNEKNNM